MRVMMNPISWFEIPVANLDRAIDFYSKVFEIEFEVTEIDGHPMALFPSEESAHGCSGALAQGDSYVPSVDGPRVYFQVVDADGTVSRALKWGSELLYPVTRVSENLVVAEFSDSEGNRLAISQNIL
jgi:predicted enzyme related to lactoylglutathione lyase